MRYNSDNSEVTLLADARNTHRSALSLLLFTLFTGAVAIMLFLGHRDSFNDALETGQCLAEEGVEDFLKALRHFLHFAYRWIFKTCD